MNTRLIGIALSLAAALPASAQPRAATATQDSALASDVRRLIEARTMSYLLGDSATYHALIAPGYVRVNDSGSRWSAEHTLEVVGRFTPDSSTPAYRPEVTQLTVRRVGAVLLADALVTLHIGSGAAATINRTRDASVLVRVGNAWKFAQHSETPFLRLNEYAVASALDSATLGDFVGDYESLPGLVEHVVQRGARLYLQDPSDPAQGSLPLIAAGAEAFYPEDDPGALRVFVRDRTGRVTHYITRMTGGPVVIARRVH